MPGPNDDEVTTSARQLMVQLMRGETDYSELDDAALFDLAAAARRGQMTLHEVIVELRSRGLTLAQIAERLDVTESTVSRWTKAPSPPGRRRQT